MISFLAWALMSEVFTRSSYGPTLFLKIVGLTPLVLKAAIPASVFVIAGVLLSPSKERKTPFVFFALGIIFSGDWVEMDMFRQVGSLEFWLTSAAGMILGSFVGLLLSLRLQSVRNRKPNKCTTDKPASPLRA